MDSGENGLGKLTLSRINDRVYFVLTDQREHVGNLKLINGAWKFKAIGYDKDGAVIPGGGPLTDRHNTAFGALDEGLINAKLAPDFQGTEGGQPMAAQVGSAAMKKVFGGEKKWLKLFVCFMTTP